MHVLVVDLEEPNRQMTMKERCVVIQAAAAVDHLTPCKQVVRRAIDQCATAEHLVDIRLIAASNRPLNDLVQQGVFREDLYHRLNLLRLVLPPLRERGATDLLALARHLLARIAARHRVTGLTITPAGDARLLAQPWRGNVRELAHELERAVIFASGTALDFAHLGGPATTSASTWRNPSWRLPEAGFSIDSVVNELIADALRDTGDNVSAAARRLGVTREYLRYRVSDREKET